MGDERWSALARVELATIARLAGDLDTAAAQGQEALRLSRAIGDLVIEAGACRSLAYTALSAGDFEAAAASATEARVVASRLGDPRSEALADLHLAAALRHQGDLAAAARILDQAEPALAERSGAALAWLWVERGQLALARGEPVEAWLSKARSAHHEDLHLDAEVAEAIRQLDRAARAGREP